MSAMNKWIRRIRRSKTMIFAMLLSAVGVVQASMGAFTHLMTPETAGMAVVAVGVVVAVLRVLTTAPLNKK